MNVETRKMPKMRVAAIEHRGPYSQIGAAFAEIGKWASDHNVPLENSIAIYYDNPRVTPEAELRSDACVPIPDGFTVPVGAVRETAVPACTYAMVPYTGPYSGLPDAWNEFVEKLLPQSGHQWADGVCFERYLNDCSTTPPEQLLTEIYTPIKG